MSEHELQAAAFPTLNHEHLDGMAECPLCKLKTFRDGEKLFEAGQREFNFYVIKSGRVEIVDRTCEAPKRVALHEPGAFTGEVSQLTGTPTFFDAIARGDCEVYEVSPDVLRLIVNTHPDLGDIIIQAFIARRHLLSAEPSFTGVRVIGSRYSPDTFRLRDFLAGNHVPFLWLDLEAEAEVKVLLDKLGLKASDTPVIAWGRDLVLKNPSNREVAEALGLRTHLEQAVYDLVVVGGGPAGLAAAVYAASEGLHTVVLERQSPGGQAGRSMRIENYLGFPTGITGSDLAERAVIQANKFGARMPIGTQVNSLTFENSYPVLHLEGGDTVTARCLLIATGADYRMLGVEGCEKFEGRGVYYAATQTEAVMCRGSNVIVVGGGNSAGQAAVFLAGQVDKVYLVVRAGSLYKDMSTYLAQRIEGTDAIEVLLDTQVKKLAGDGSLREAELFNSRTGQARTVACAGLFSFIGAVPRTDWLPPQIEKDEKGFVKTGPDLHKSPHWTVRRQPFLLETSQPCVFAAGDVRSGSVKRVASAVGEGSMSVQFVHQCFRER